MRPSLSADVGAPWRGITRAASLTRCVATAAGDQSTARRTEPRPRGADEHRRTPADRARRAPQRPRRDVHRPGGDAGARCRATPAAVLDLSTPPDHRDRARRRVAMAAREPRRSLGGPEDISGANGTAIWSPVAREHGGTRVRIGYPHVLSRSVASYMAQRRATHETVRVENERKDSRCRECGAVERASGWSWELGLEDGVARCDCCRLLSDNSIAPRPRRRFRLCRPTVPIPR
jgi:hypothetical protein